MLGNTSTYISDIRVTFEHHLTGDHPPSFTVENVPDAVNPVKGRLAFVQVPNGDTTTLQLVWKFEVEMKDNWYEAAVAAEAPHRIVSVVDWASDSPVPMAPVPPKGGEGATSLTRSRPSLLARAPLRERSRVVALPRQRLVQDR